MYNHSTSLFEYMIDMHSTDKQSELDLHSQYTVILSELAIHSIQCISSEENEFGLMLTKKCLNIWSSKKCSFKIFNHTLHHYNPYKLILFILNYIFDHAPSEIPFVSTNKKICRFYTQKVLRKWLEYTFDNGSRQGHTTYALVINLYSNYLIDFKDTLTAKHADRLRYILIKLLIFKYKRLRCRNKNKKCRDRRKILFLLDTLMHQLNSRKIRTKIKKLMPATIIIYKKSNKKRLIRNIYTPKYADEMKTMISKKLSKIIDLKNIHLITNLANTKECDYCHKKDIKLKKCKSCLQVFYCSVKCQKKGWKKTHSLTCSEFINKPLYMSLNKSSKPNNYYLMC
eukprot:227355_1